MVRLAHLESGSTVQCAPVSLRVQRHLSTPCLVSRHSLTSSVIYGTKKGGGGPAGQWPGCSGIGVRVVKPADPSRPPFFVRRKTSRGNMKNSFHSTPSDIFDAASGAATHRSSTSAI